MLNYINPLKIYAYLFSCIAFKVGDKILDSTIKYIHFDWDLGIWRVEFDDKL